MLLPNISGYKEAPFVEINDMFLYKFSEDLNDKTIYYHVKEYQDGQPLKNVLTDKTNGKRYVYTKVLYKGSNAEHPDEDIFSMVDKDCNKELDELRKANSEYGMESQEHKDAAKKMSDCRYIYERSGDARKDYFIMIKTSWLGGKSRKSKKSKKSKKARKSRRSKK